MCETLYYDVDGVLLDFCGPFADFWNKGAEEKLWKGDNIEKNPLTWNFGLNYDIKDTAEALDEFHRIHEHLPVMHEDLPSILDKLKCKYRIELVTAYPNENKRIKNLLHHNLPYDKLTCGVTDKLSYIKECESNGATVVAIFEDGPHHLEAFLPHYANKIWAPRCWKYLAPYENDSRIRLYETPHEWMTLLNL